jgi:polyhydroxyalkanoate synthesis repressor PhaR
MAERIIIKKYSNRRLYDTRQSRYINLEDIPQLLKDGHDVEVRDASTGDDITTTVLLQLIVEREKRKVEGLPVELLKEFVILQDTPARRFFDVAIQQSLAILREMKRVGMPLSAGEHANLFDPNYWMDRFMGGFGRKPSATPPPRQPEPEPEPEVEPEPPEEKAEDLVLKELRELRARLERIEKDRKE